MDSSTPRLGLKIDVVLQESWGSHTDHRDDPIHSWRHQVCSLTGVSLRSELKHGLTFVSPPCAEFRNLGNRSSVRDSAQIKADLDFNSTHPYELKSIMRVCNVQYGKRCGGPCMLATVDAR